MHKLIIQSRDSEFPHLPDNLRLGSYSRELYRFENGTVELGRCAGVDYQTFLKRDGSPVGLIDSEEPAYWFVTLLLLDAMGEEERVAHHERNV